MTPIVRPRIVIATLATCLVACTSDERTVAGEHVVTQPTRLCREATLPRSCRNAGDVEAMLKRDDLEIVAATATSTGVQRAQVLTLRSGGVVFRAKWRALSTTTRRNSPRFELAAYAVQKLFLPPHEYVVPPTAAHCFPLAAYRARVDRAAQPTYKGSGCVYGILSYWLEDVTSVADAPRWFHGQYGHALDPALFERDPAYRESIARVNVLTYVIKHADSHARNFVIGRSDSTPIVYSIDNSLSFTMAKNPRVQPRHDWSVIRVPALPRAVIDRLRTADERLASLATLAELRRDDRLVATVGLTPAEIAGVRERISALLARVDAGTLRTY